MRDKKQDQSGAGPAGQEQDGASPQARALAHKRQQHAKAAKANAYNSSHPDTVAAFNEATNGSCLYLGQLSATKIMSWQKAHGLTADGKIGPETVAQAKASSGGEVQGEKAEPKKAAPTPVLAPEEESKVEMDPSVAALFEAETPSTDEKMGTDEKEIKQQANECRAALFAHLDRFQHASTVATKIALGGVAGMGDIRTSEQKTADKVAGLAKIALSMAWNACGGAAEIESVMKIAKEELLGDSAEITDKAYETMKSGIEKLNGDVSLNDVTKDLARVVTEGTNTFVERGKAGLSRADDAALASSWRLIQGTADNMKDKNDTKLDPGQKVTVTTEMLELMTGIEVSGVFAVQLANTLRQQAMVDFAGLMANPRERTEALDKALEGNVGAETKKISEETADDQWLKTDAANRDKVKQ